jgi:uncharacterized protein (TIGR03118 family)
VAGSASAKRPAYVQTNLVSDGTVQAVTTDPNLKNPWGIAFFPELSPFWISDNNAGVSTLYDGAGVPYPNPMTPLIVKIPTPSSPTGGAPSGLIANKFFPSDFTIGTTGASLFIFSTEDGTIVAWDLHLPDITEAVIVKDNSAGGGPTGAVYKGLAIGTDGGANFLYATNFRSGQIEAYNTNFALTTLGGSFSDPKLPKGYAPFGIQNINGQLFVTYAVQDTPKHDPVNGPAHGIVDIFDTEGHLLRRFVTHGLLNSPWGVALAPNTFGAFGGDMLIGNFGDGKINVYDPTTGAFIGVLTGTNNQPLVNDGLWALTFGGATNSSPDTLYFTAGLNSEVDGLFGSIVPE